MNCNSNVSNLFWRVDLLFHTYILHSVKIIYLFILSFNGKIHNRYCVKGGFGVSKNQKSAPRRKSKRERRTKFFIYVMVIAMILSLFTAGLRSEENTSELQSRVHLVFRLLLE